MSTSITSQVVWPELAAALADWLAGRVMAPATILREFGSLPLARVHHAGGRAKAPQELAGRRFQVYATRTEHDALSRAASAAGVGMQEIVTREICRIVGAKYHAPARKQQGSAAQRAADAAAEKQALSVEREKQRARQDRARAARRGPLRAEDMPCPVENPSAAFLRWLAL